MGIEPTQSAWKAEVLPLNYTRLFLLFIWWRGKDSNLRRQSRQIYSLIPLTAREPLQKEVYFLRCINESQAFLYILCYIYFSTYNTTVIL
jgi:hypothetical protein